MALIYLQCLLLLSCLVMIMSDSRDDSPLTVLASCEEDVTLPCVNANMTELKSGYTFRWMKYSAHKGAMEDVLTWPLKPQHTRRMKWKEDGGGQMSLLLTNVQRSDEGLYSCEVCQGWDCSLVRNISLRVKDCKVLPALRAAPGAPIKLNFPVDVTSRPQNVTWWLLKGGEPLPLPSNRVQVKHTLLVIEPMSKGDSGWYRCNYIYRQTNRCFDIKIQIQDVEVTAAPVVVATQTQEHTPEGRMGAVAAAAVSSVFVIGIVVAAVVLRVFIYSRRNGRRVPRQTWMSAVAETQSVTYETVPHGDVCLNQHTNSIYVSEDKTTSTFHR